MAAFLSIIIFLFLALIIAIPAYFLTCKERDKNTDLKHIHLIGNALFTLWAVYDLNFTQHYMHGPNTTFLILPGAIGLMLYYSFMYKKTLNADKTPKHSLIIVGMYIIFIAYGITTQT